MSSITNITPERPFKMRRIAKPPFERQNARLNLLTNVSRDTLQSMISTPANSEESSSSSSPEMSLISE